MDVRWGAVLRAMIFSSIGLSIFLLTKRRSNQPQSALFEICRRNLRIAGIIAAIGGAGVAIHLLLIILGYLAY
jgi:hypothetical protein